MRLFQMLGRGGELTRARADHAEEAMKGRRIAPAVLESLLRYRPGAREIALAGRLHGLVQHISVVDHIGG